VRSPLRSNVAAVQVKTFQFKLLLQESSRNFEVGIAAQE